MEIEVRVTAYDTIAISWENVPGVAQYVLYRDGSEIHRTPSTSYTDAGLQTTALIRHFYQVDALDSDQQVVDRTGRAESSLDCPVGELPEPVLAGHEDWIELYWRAWQLAWEKVQSPVPGSGFVSHWMDEAFAPQIFLWHIAFIVMFGRYGRRAFPAVESLDNLYVKQHPDGYICREIREGDGTDYWPTGDAQAVGPPLLAWAELADFELSADTKRLEHVLPFLVKHFDWMKSSRRRPNGLYWTSHLASGMDNLPRQAWCWIDMSAQQALAAFCIARIAEIVGDAALVARFRREYGMLKQLVNKLAWCEEDGFYYDLARDGSFSKLLSAASFWPLTARIPTQRMAERIAEHLTDPDQFKRPSMVPALAANHSAYDPRGRYWLGGVWAPVNYCLVRGLAAYGMDDLASEIARNHINCVAAVYKDTGTIWENYAPEYLEKGASAKPGFVGWSGLGPIAMLIEDVLGIKADALGRRVHWRLYEPADETDARRLPRQGIRRFPLGADLVSFVCRERPGRGVEIELECGGPFELTVARGGATRVVKVKAAESGVVLAF